MLDVVELFVEQFANALAALRLNAGGLFHYHIGVHHYQSPICVIGEPLVAALCDQAADRVFGQADVEHRLHHSGHRAACARADRDEQRVFRVAKLAAGELFHFSDRLIGLVPESCRVLFAVFVKVRANLGRDGKSRRNRELEVRVAGHFGQVRTFSAQKVFHRFVAFCLAAAKEIYEFLIFIRFCHRSNIECYANFSDTVPARI